MRLPRDLTGRELATHLGREFGYEVTRQRGSHLRLSTAVGGVHHLTVPDPDPLRLGTLAGILADVADHFGLTRDEVARRLMLD